MNTPLISLILTLILILLTLRVVFFFLYSGIYSLGKISYFLKLNNIII